MAGRSQRAQLWHSRPALAGRRDELPKTASFLPVVPCARAAKVGQLMGNRAPPKAPQPAAGVLRRKKIGRFCTFLGAFGASFCAEMVKNAFRACGGQGGLRRFLIANGS